MNKSLALQVSNLSWSEAEFNAACEKLAAQRALDEDRAFKDPAFCAAFVEAEKADSQRRLRALCDRDPLIAETVARAEAMRLEAAELTQRDTVDSDPMPFHVTLESAAA